MDEEDKHSVLTPTTPKLNGDTNGGQSAESDDAGNNHVQSGGTGRYRTYDMDRTCQAEDGILEAKSERFKTGEGDKRESLPPLFLRNPLWRAIVSAPCGGTG